MYVQCASFLVILCEEKILLKNVMMEERTLFLYTFIDILQIFHSILYVDQVMYSVRQKKQQTRGKEREQLEPAVTSGR